MIELKGIFPALITPFTGNGALHEDALRRVVRRNLDSGVAGFYACGSTAEAFLLTREERKRALEMIIEAARSWAKERALPERPVIAHVGSISTDEAIDLALHAKGAGASAISAVPPFYYAFSFEEVRRYYFDIADAAGLPLIAYNIPAFTGVELTPERVRLLRKNEFIAGVKHTSMNQHQLERMRSDDPGLVILSGADEVCLTALIMGADGAIGANFNVLADRFVRIDRLFLEGRVDEAARIQREANGVIEVISRHGFIRSIKYLLSLEGIDCGECRKPFAPLSADAMRELETVHREHLKKE